MTLLKQICLALIASVVGALPAYADCQQPQPPSKIPDANTASEQEMLVAMETLKQYSGDVNVFLKCLEFEEKQNHLSSADGERQHNAVVTQLERVAAKFNEQVRAFKAKHS
jgi:hypothetical protein